MILVSSLVRRMLAFGNRAWRHFATVLNDRAKAHEISEVTGFETKPLTLDKLQALLEKYFPEVVA